MFNCLGHQSWATNTGPLLKKHPEFDETPHIPADNKGIYCREWCPSHPDVNKVVFDLSDELIDAFEADALHVGMDEVFLIGSDKCPRCKGKDVGELFAGVVNRLHQHLVEEKGVEMLMWGDRLLDAGKFTYGTMGGEQDRLAPRDRPDPQGHHHLRLALRAAGRLSLGPLLPTAGIPRAALDLEESRRGGGLGPLRPQGRHRADAGRAVHRLVGRRQRREACGGAGKSAGERQVAGPLSSRSRPRFTRG